VSAKRLSSADAYSRALLVAANSLSYAPTATRSMALAVCLSARGQRYRVSYIPDPVCWTEAPEDLATLAKQRKRWQRGLAESLWENRKLLFARGSGAAGWLAFLFFIVFELLSPLAEVGGLAVMALAWATGGMTSTGFLAFVAAPFALGVMLSTTSLLLEELSFHTYPKARHLLALFAVSVLRTSASASSTRGGGCRRSGAGCAASACSGAR
jgi:cellulose synthase/poly-beta-1,6-N-acetylglucosamine synthase-like glycosyltransferase